MVEKIFVVDCQKKNKNWQRCIYPKLIENFVQWCGSNEIKFNRKDIGTL